MSAIPKGSRVVVTGANGFTASHIIDRLLQDGYKVRGTVRAESKAAWMKDFWTKEYKDGSLEFTTVEDMAAKGAYDEAVKGATGVIHVASNLTFSPDPEAVIPETVEGTKNALTAAKSEPSVKRFVLTSSAAAVTWPKPNVEFDIDDKTWNKEAVERARSSPNAWDVYAASKVLSEQALWEFTDKEKPNFVANAVIPNAIWGPILAPGKQDKISAAGFIVGLFEKGSPEGLEAIPPQHHVDVRDVARLHVAALVDPEIKNERIFAYGEPYNWNKVMGVMRKLAPSKKFSEDIPDIGEDKSHIVSRSRAERILQKHYGVNFTSMEQTVKDNVKHLL